MHWIAQYWLEAVFAAVIAFLGVAYKTLAGRVKKEVEEQKALCDGVQSLLRDRIIQAYNHHTEKGYIPIYGMENVHAMYKSYHELGGNGTITNLVESLEDLPTVKPEG